MLQANENCDIQYEIRGFILIETREVIMVNCTIEGQSRGDLPKVCK